MAKKNRVSTEDVSSKKPLWILVTVGLLAIAAIAGSYAIWDGSSKPNTSVEALKETATLPGRMVLPASGRTPRPETLNPAQFSDLETRQAYQAAKDVPEVLEHLPCYCGCFAAAGHRSNLECFKDNHGTECSLCRAIAIEGKKLHDEGRTIAEIQHDVNTRWAPLMK